MALFGPDISNNNWTDPTQAAQFVNTLKAQGFSWVEAKVSQGSDYQDPDWAATLQACNAAALPCIGYHYVDTSDPASQAQCFTSNGGGTVAMFDVEDGSGDINNYWAVVNAFNTAGIQVVLSYIPQWYWEEIGSPDLSTVPGLIASAYPNTAEAFAAALYAEDGGNTGEGWGSYGGATPVMWQFTDAANIDGYSMDCNAFQGTAEQLEAILGAAVTQPVLAVVQDNQTQLRGPGLDGWPQLGGHTLVDALAAIGQKLGIDGFTPPEA